VPCNARFSPCSHAFESLTVNLKTFTVARKIPFDDPDILNYVRIGYVTAQLVILGVYYYVSITVRATFTKSAFFHQ
jgi:hypothetical protein